MELVFLGLLFAVLIIALGVGFPVAFALPGAGILTIGLAAGAGWLFTGNANSYFLSGGAVEWISAGVTNFRGIYWEADRDTLIAVPLFVFMGIMLQRSRIAEDLLVTMAKLFGALPGGLGISVVVVGALLAATTGVVGATVVAMGLISLPAMMRNNYSQPLATGTILSSGTLGQIIPPSIVLIILADQLSSAVDQAAQLRTQEFRDATGEFAMPSQFGVTPTSAGDMFMGALVPGLVLVGLYVAYILVFAILRPRSAPSVPIEGRLDAAFWLTVFFNTVPPLVLIVLVLGSIITGVATVTQAGAVGAAGAVVMAGYKLHAGRARYLPATLVIAALVAIYGLQGLFELNVRRMETDRDVLGVWLAALAVAVLLVGLGWSGWRTLRIENTLRMVMTETAKTASLVFIILLGAAMLISAFRAFGGEILVTDYLSTLPGGFWAQFFVVMAVIFLLGFFLDFIEIAIVVVPIVAPILLMNPEANVTAVWLGVMIGLNIQTSFLTPPFGFALFYLRGVASSTVKTLAMYKGVVPFIALQLLALVIVGFNPAMVNYVPTRMSLLSEQAPPPRNPRLQPCVEEYLMRELPAREAAIRESMDDVATVDHGALPEDAARDVAEALEGYDASFGHMRELVAARDAVQAAAPEYRPLHREVSRIRRETAGLETRIEAARDQMRDFRGDTPEAVAGRERLQARIAMLESERDALEQERPEGWEAARDAFRALTDAEQEARIAYQRSADASYAVLRDLVAEIRAGDDLAEIESRIAAMADWITAVEGGTLAAEEAVERIRIVERDLREIAGTQGLQAELQNLRRALDGATPDPQAASGHLEATRAELAGEIAWRSAAQDAILDPLAALEAETRDTLGLREQPRLAREQALDVAACMSGHRDISLYF